MSNILNPFRGEFSVKINGKTHEGIFTINALRMLTSDLKIPFTEFDKFIAEDQLTAVPMIAYYSVLNAAMRKGKDFKMGREQFAALFFDEGQNLDNVLECIVEALGAPEDETEGN